MTAPKPQQMQSRNDRVNTSNTRRRLAMFDSYERAGASPTAISASSTPARLCQRRVLDRRNAPQQPYRLVACTLGQIKERSCGRSEAVGNADQLAAHELLQLIPQPRQLSDCARNYQRHGGPRGAQL